jgi:hypothetical protein
MQGQLQLILPQATLDDLPLILPRYEGLDITVSLLPQNTLSREAIREPESTPAVKREIRIAKGILPSAIVSLADTVIDAFSDILVSKKK